MLKGNQKKLDKNKNKRIDAEDFAMLRREKSPMKAKRGRLAGQDFNERMKNVEKGLINKKTGKPTSMMAMRELKGFKPGESSQKFLERRLDLGKAKDAIKRTRIGKIALGVAGVGLAAKALLDKKKKEAQEKKKNKKMGGGMMKRPGYKKGKAIMIMVAVGKPKKKMGGGLAAATERLKAQGKMGGGMMKPQKANLGLLMMKKAKDKGAKGLEFLSPLAMLKRVQGRKKGGAMKYTKGGGADTGRIGEIKSKLGVITQKLGKIPGRLTDKDRENLKKLRPTKPEKPLKKMGGGMMQPVMPMYKKGTMIKARGGGLAKTKPTKMY